MSNKKRKRAEDGSENSSQDIAVNSVHDSQSASRLVRVKYFPATDTMKPVIAAGVSAPTDLEYETYIKTNKDNETELLLRSTTHPTLDYTAKENESSNDRHLNHYLAVFDPATNSLGFHDAKKVTLRSSLRLRDPEPNSDGEANTDSKAPVVGYAARAALAAAFGTKKSKKAVQSIAENRLISAGDENGASNPLSQAILSSMPTSNPSEAPGSPNSTTSQQPHTKPIPQANTTATDIASVYPPSHLVYPQPASETLASMPTAPWLHLISTSKLIRTNSRFISNRVEYLCKSHLASSSDETIPSPATLHLLQLHRYILILLDIHRHIRSIPSTRPIGSPSSFPPGTITGPNIAHALTTSILSTYCPGLKGPTKNQLTLLTSTILALALHIPPPSLSTGQANTQILDPTDLELDLGMTHDAVRSLLRELGCRIEVGKEAQLERWGYKVKKIKTEAVVMAGQRRFAVLKFPLVFVGGKTGGAAGRGGARGRGRGRGR